MKRWAVACFVFGGVVAIACNLSPVEDLPVDSGTGSGATANGTGGGSIDLGTGGANGSDDPQAGQAGASGEGPGGLGGMSGSTGTSGSGGGVR